MRIGAIVLPLAISFFTFQQIGYLADSARGVNRDRDFLRYAVFSSFFPVPIAGPMVHAREVIPQLDKKNLWRLDPANFAVGVTIFGFGLAKKVLIADPLAIHVDSLFGASAAGLRLTPIEAWLAALDITVQLYFDFSGYSDMAIGLARMLGILLPENFFSPYKALSIADFWNRWHITPSRFLRDRMYLPMVLRKGRPRCGPALCGAVHHHGSGRTMAQCRLDLCRMGRGARSDAGGARWMADGARMARALAPGRFGCGPHHRARDNRPRRGTFDDPFSRRCGRARAPVSDRREWIA